METMKGKITGLWLGCPVSDLLMRCRAYSFIGSQIIH